MKLFVRWSFSVALSRCVDVTSPTIVVSTRLNDCAGWRWYANARNSSVMHALFRTRWHNCTYWMHASLGTASLVPSSPSVINYPRTGSWQKLSQRSAFGVLRHSPTSISQQCTTGSDASTATARTTATCEGSNAYLHSAAGTVGGETARARISFFAQPENLALPLRRACAFHYSHPLRSLMPSALIDTAIDRVMNNLVQPAAQNYG